MMTGDGSSLTWMGDGTRTGENGEGDFGSGEEDKGKLDRISVCVGFSPVKESLKVGENLKKL